MVPLWRQAFDSWEKAASPVLQKTAVSPGFRDFMRVSTRVNKSVAAEFEKASRQWLHAMNLPAATDVRRLRAQLRELDKELHGLRSAVESLAEDATIRELTALLTNEREASAGAIDVEPVSGGSKHKGGEKSKSSKKSDGHR